MLSAERFKRYFAISIEFCICFDNYYSTRSLLSIIYLVFFSYYHSVKI
jgi:hypothetical protein